MGSVVFVSEQKGSAMAKEQKVCFVVNEKSAAGKTKRSWAQTEKALRERGQAFEVKYTEKMGDGTRLTQEALALGCDLIISVGGDGTNNEVINGFFGEDGTPRREGAMFSFLASGTGSDLRRSLPALQQPDDILAMIQRGESHLLDIGRLRYQSLEGEEKLRFFLNITSFGMSAKITDDVNRSSLKRLSGSLAFHLSSIRGFFGFPNVPMRVSLDDKEPFEVACRLGVVANGRCFGGGMRVAPNALMDDGLFEVMLLDGAGTWALLRHFGSIYKGTHLGLPWIRSARAQKIAVSCDLRDVLFESDGEVFGKLPMTFEMFARVLPFRHLPNQEGAFGEK
jgi:YegS/Rv2252/BmrU family lipid kinase